MKNKNLNTLKEKLLRTKIEAGASLKMPPPTIVHLDKKKQQAKVACRRSKQQ